MKLFDSEWKVMEVLWRENDLTAKEISLRLAESIGWSKNTTYTVLKKCIDKGAIERREPNFVCHAAITKAQAQKEEADSLLDKVFGGSAELLFASILSDRRLLEGRGRAAARAGGGIRGMKGMRRRPCSAGAR